MKGLLIFVGLVLTVAIAVEVAAIGGAWWLHGQKHFDQEIRWLESFQPVLGWDEAYRLHIGKLYRDRVRRELDADRVDLAVVALRSARARDRAAGPEIHRELMVLGIETYTRAADRMEAHGQLSGAADWDDSLFVLAVRAPEPHHRYAALAAFMEGLDLRVRDGEPCAALARVEWAKRGLGGTIPGLQPSVEEDLRVQCDRAKGRRR